MLATDSKMIEDKFLGAFETTGEWRTPKPGEYYLCSDGNVGLASEVNGRRAWLAHSILRRITVRHMPITK